MRGRRRRGGTPSPPAHRTHPARREGNPGSARGGGTALDFTGSFTLLVTPLAPDGSIAWADYDRLLDYHLAAGGRGLFAVCGTSEMGALTPAERLALAERAVARAGVRPVVAAANLEPDPQACLEEVRRTSRTGVAAVVLVPPARPAPDDEALYAWFAQLAAASAVPALLYEWPGRQPHAIPPAVYGRLVRECGVVGIKDTTCTAEGLAAKLAAAPAGIVFQANNPLLAASLEAGARGTMTIASAVRPDLLATLWAAHRAGERARAAALAREIVFLDAVLGPCHPGGAKWLLRRAGVLAHDACRAGRTPDGAGRAALEAWAGGAPPWCGPGRVPGGG